MTRGRPGRREMVRTRSAKGYRKFAGKMFTLHCRASTKRSAENTKREMKRDGWNVRVTKTKGVLPYSIWIRRRK